MVEVLVVDKTLRNHSRPTDHKLVFLWHSVLADVWDAALEFMCTHCVYSHYTNDSDRKCRPVGSAISFLSKSFCLFDCECKLFHKLLVTFVRRQVQTIETVKRTGCISPTVQQVPIACCTQSKPGLERMMGCEHSKQDTAEIRFAAQRFTAI